MTCRLCLENRPLRQSHIFPELLYRPIYGASHTMLTINPELPYERRLRKGLREPLLCDNCEGRFQQYEDYFARLWFMERQLPEELTADTLMVTIRGLDYRLFKLFHMSVFWRAGVSSLPDFAAVSLGPHEDRMRTLLLQGNAGGVQEYQVLCTVLRQPGGRNPYYGLVTAASRSRSDGLWHYGAIYAGCLWTVIVSKSAPILGGLTPQGILVPDVADAVDVPFLKPTLRRYASHLRKYLSGPGAA